MITVVENDRVCGQASRFDYVKVFSGIFVRLAYFVLVLSPVLAYFGRIGMVGRHAHLGWIRDLFVRACPDLAFMTLG